MRIFSTLIFLLLAIATLAQDTVLLRDSMLATMELKGHKLRRFHLQRKAPPEGNWAGYEIGPMTTYVSRGETAQDQGRWLLYATGQQAAGQRKGLWRFYGVENNTWRHVLLEEAQFANGVKDGEAVSYFPDGKVAARTNWVGGQRNGPATVYYPHGEVYATGQWRNDSLDGTVRAYLPKGYPLRIMNYRLGKLQGPFKSYHTNAQLKEEGSFADNELNGNYRYYYPNGRLWVERDYRRDRLINIVLLYDAQGQPLDKGSLKDGNGTVNTYNDQGRLEAVRHYEDGRLIKEERMP